MYLHGNELFSEKGVMVDVLEKNMLRPIMLLYVICANPLEIKGCKAEKKKKSRSPGRNETADKGEII